MKQEQQTRHFSAMAKRYGIKDVERFKTSARRYECKLNRLAVIICNDSSLYEWAQEEFDRVRDRAKATLSAYCRFRKKFLGELVFNKDPRGYSMKVEAKDLGRGIWTDWGGYGIVAPSIKDN